MNGGYEGMSMAGPSRVVPSRNEQDDEEDYGFRFGQLTMDDERFNPPSYGFNPSAPAFNGRPSYTASGGGYQQHPSQSPMYSTPSSPYIPHQHHLQHHPLQAQTPFIPYQHWSSPPMSPAISSHQQFAAVRARHGSFAEDMGMTQPPWTPNQGQTRGYHQMQFHQQMSSAMHHQSPGMPPSAWTSPSAPSSYQFYTPHQQYQTQFETPSPNVPMTPKFRNRMSWSGPPGKLDGADKERERKAYHPQPPAKRSDWVMWVGNVPQNTSHEELWRYFNQTIPPGDDEWRGPSSIFLISRSSCAFVNLSSQADLDRAVAFFNGRPLRAFDPRCPRMVCRVRRKDDDLRAGVGAQRGTGMHREWVKNMGGGGVTAVQVDIPNTEPPSPGIPLSPAAMEPAPEGEGRRRESIVDATETAAAAADAKHKSSNSYASTNSSFLVRHFPKRVFILKSSTQAELEESVQTGTWRTQKHNEPILDQAYRTAPEVYLIFGANKAGEFFGYAKMTEPIDKEKAAARAAKLAQTQQVQSPSSGDQRERASISSCRPASQFAPDRPTMMSPQSSSSGVPMASPSSLTPGTEDEPNFDMNSIMTDGGHHPKPRYSDGHHSIVSAPADLRPTTLDPKLLHQSSMSRNIAALRAAEGSTLDPKLLQQSHMAAPIAAIRAAEGSTAKQLAQGSSDRAQEMDDQGVLRKDTIPSPRIEKNEAGAMKQEVQDETEDHREGAEDNKGLSFRIEWVMVGAVPFGRTRHLRNPWNTDKEVKVSRDGTEVEPNVGSLLMAEWDKV